MALERLHKNYGVLYLLMFGVLFLLQLTLSFCIEITVSPPGENFFGAISGVTAGDDVFEFFFTPVTS